MTISDFPAGARITESPEGGSARTIAVAVKAKIHWVTENIPPVLLTATAHGESAREDSIAPRAGFRYARGMVASLLIGHEENRAFSELLRPEPLADGLEPEERVIACGISWQRYLALDKALGDDRPGPRFYYLDGDLEIMSTSEEHERIKKWIAGFMDIYFEETETENMPRGQATMRLALKQAGAEPDESWCILEEKKFPDLVLEIALTSGGLKKLELYRRFKVLEVWFWRRGKLEIHALLPDGSGYDPVRKSRILPRLDTALLVRCVAIPSWLEARRAFRAGLAAK